MSRRHRALYDLNLIFEDVCFHLVLRNFGLEFSDQRIMLFYIAFNLIKLRDLHCNLRLRGFQKFIAERLECTYIHKVGDSSTPSRSTIIGR